MSLMCRPMWPFLLMYGSHDMRHIGFPPVDGGQRDPREMGLHNTSPCGSISVLRYTILLDTTRALAHIGALPSLYKSHITLLRYHRAKFGVLD